METINAVLVKIEDDRIVVIGGEKYLLMSKIAPEVKKAPKAPRKRRPYATHGKVETAVIAILAETPELKNGEIRIILKAKYGLEPGNDAFRKILGRMKQKGLLETEGVKNGTKWLLKKHEATTSNNGQDALDREPEHIEF